ncbi:MAG: hypothetical protein WA740_01150 [Candidatus Binataceae bacterium]
MREGCSNLDKVGPSIFRNGAFSVGSFGIFSIDSKNKLLAYAGDFAEWVRFRRLFGTSIFGAFEAARKTKHEGTKEDLVVGLITAPGREGILVEKGGQRSPGRCADRFHAISFARSEVGHKAEQFSHEQIWQKPERSLGKRHGAKMA